MGQTVHVDTTRARVKLRTAFFAQLCIPYGGTVSMQRRRTLGAHLNDAVERMAPDGDAVRISVIVLPNHLLLSLSGTTTAIARWADPSTLAVPLREAVRASEPERSVPVVATSRHYPRSHREVAPSPARGWARGGRPGA